MSVVWAHVLDEVGSADFYGSEEEARRQRDLLGGGLDRIETITVIPFCEADR